jgi:hypothetical protein
MNNSMNRMKSNFIKITYCILTFFLIFVFSNIAFSTDYLIITGENVNVREKPSIDSKILTKVNLGRYITILNKISKNVTIDGKTGMWVYIDTRQIPENKENTIKGWVFDHYIGYKEKFIKVTKWRKFELKDIIIDDDWYYLFNDDGSFILKKSYYKCDDKTPEICKKAQGNFNDQDCLCYFKGHIYKLNNLLWAKIDSIKDGGDNYLFLNSKGDVCVMYDGLYCEQK